MNVVTDIIPFVVIALVLVFVVTRRSRGAGQPPSRPSRGGLTAALPAASQPALRLLPLPGDIGLVAAREFRTRVRGRVFRTGTLLVLVIVAAAIVVPTLLSSKASTQRVGVAGQLSAPIRAEVVADGTAVGDQVEIVAEPTGHAAAADLRAGRIDLAIVNARQLLVAKTVAASDTSAAAELTRAVAGTVGTGEALQAAGLTPAQAAIIAGAHPLPVSVLAYLPPTAPFAMPVLVSLGAVPAWQFALSAAISAACTAGLARGAIAVYRTSILQAGRRVPLRELLTR